MDDNSEIISIFINAQKEAEELFIKNNLDEHEINKFNNEQKIKLLEFKNKLRDYKLNIIKFCEINNKKNIYVNETNINWEQQYFSK